DAALQDGRRLRLARQLGIGDFVAVVPKLARPFDSDEEVGMATPAAVEERALIDDVGTRLHGGDRLRMRLLQVGDRALGKRELDGLQALRLEPGQMLAFVLQAATAEHVQHRVVTLGPRDLTASGSQLLLRQVLALEKARQIRRADDQPTLKELHLALLLQGSL